MLRRPPIIEVSQRLWPRYMLGCMMAVAVLSGCQGRRLLLNEGKLDQGLVIVLPGIDGLAPYNVNACKALYEDGLGMAVELYDWTLPFGMILNQCSILTNRLAAEGLAARIVKYREEYPDRPVVLIGLSGGTAIAVWAAEALPDEERVDRIVLLASSLSPGYDLSEAIGHTRLGIVSFYSDYDGALLGIGTILMGTMDGQHTEAAGKVGFRPPDRAAGYYGGLIQVAWEPTMAATGHDGGHFGYTAPGFIKARVRPYVTDARWNDYLANARAAPPATAGEGQTAELAVTRSK